MSAAIKAVQISRSFGPKLVFQNLNFEMHHGEFISLIGANGSGKTTLLRTLAGLIAPTSGRIERETRQSIGWLPANDQGMIPLFTGMENLKFFASLHGISEPEASSFAEEFMDILPLVNSLQVPFYQCSLGMKQSLKMVRALLLQPTLLLMDEPFKSLDEDAASKFKKYLSQELKSCCVLMAAPNQHDLEGLTFHRRLEIKAGTLNA